MSAGAGLHGRDIVCVGFADWDTELWTNQHHLMSRLARDNRILFVESLGLRRPQFSGRDLRRIARRARRGIGGPRPRDGLHVLSPLVLPFHSVALARAVNARLLPALVRRAARRVGLERPILWSYVPQAEVLIEPLDASLVIYHCVDDLGAVEGIDAAGVRAAEARFAARADLVLASAPALVERMRSHSDNVLFVPNVADTELFATALEPGPVDARVDALPAPRIVFTGAVVESKLDFGLLEELARRRPHWSLALVGPIGPGDPSTDVSGLEALPNVHLLGPRRYAELPAVLRGADVGIIPYAVNDITRSVFPMKVYEYLAAGLPVVATPLPALAGVEGVTVADGVAAMAERIDTELADDDEARRRARSELAASHSWDARIAELSAAVERL